MDGVILDGEGGMRCGRCCSEVGDEGGDGFVRDEFVRDEGFVEFVRYEGFVEFVQSFLSCCVFHVKLKVVGVGGAIFTVEVLYCAS